MSAPSPRTTDQLGRPLHDLRVSVTDRCNFRCRYCMPRERFGPDFAFVERGALLTFEEIDRLVRITTRLGVRKVRLTGGEPLLRRDLPRLVALLTAIPEIDDLAMTTNGALLAEHAAALAGAGLQRVTVSLDALDPETFAAMSDTTLPVEKVLEGIAAAAAAGLDPVKVNSVVRRGMNDGEIERLARFGREHGHTMRFIEYMDVGTTNRWRRDEVVPAAEILEAVDAVYPLEPVTEVSASAVASRYRYRDGGGEIGIIASVTVPFCATCVRARISPVGEVFTCLFAASGHDLRAQLRGDATDDEIADRLARIWGARTDRYSELRSGATRQLPKVEMSYIGG